MDDDAWTDIGAAAARVVMGVARPGVPGTVCSLTGPLVLADDPHHGLPRWLDANPYRIFGGRNCAARHSGIAAGTERGAPAPREAEAGASAQAGTGGNRRAQHGKPEGGAGAVIWVNFGTGAAQPFGPTWPPRQYGIIDRTSDGKSPSQLIHNDPGTARCGNRR